MSAEYDLSYERGFDAGLIDGKEGERSPYPRAETKAEWAGYAAGYDTGWLVGYERELERMLHLWRLAQLLPPDPYRLAAEAALAYSGHEPFFTPAELEAIRAEQEAIARVITVPSCLQRRD
ncbi:hypothetical protein EJ069_10410 [Mesorhizobium sp. M2A.F.Ca.ET.043.05.1.1]|uniref:hypothetical protein n=1 Tax=Mesorhizobium sp. M2A.F.Ca.ET.043.05.1.1 TaxID=2493671 RepID=UPI000F74E382|nr:hypothetical protein [Mesorhizobium sp. M2A.F.Ca.ET.043.05.1.1]AZO15107.1 hypothetical protein EJ069_10410 [Mesorhizobium sp. M2A.F.Ca.ET.043.05.1.1]